MQGILKTYFPQESRDLNNKVDKWREISRNKRNSFERNERTWIKNLKRRSKRIHQSHPAQYRQGYVTFSDEWP